jgi:hypothetical protein
MFMIFDNHAVNFDLVTRMFEEAPGIVRIHLVNSSLFVHGATIDQILTAKAAGQSRVTASAVHTSPPVQQQTIPTDAELRDQFSQGMLRDQPKQPFDDGSKNGIARGNDPQAMNAIGRQR